MKEFKLVIVLLVALFAISTTAAAESGHSHSDEETSEESAFPGLKDGGCYTAKCSSYTMCQFGYQELRVDKRSCPRGQEKKICCKQTPGCVDTLCEPYTPRCPSGTTEYSRDSVVCDSRAPIMTTLHCCNEGYTPHCFNTSCATNGGVIGQGEGCPTEYHEVDGGQGEEWGCPRDANYVYGRKTCCLPQKEEDEEEDEESSSGNLRQNSGILLMALMGMVMGLSK